MAKKDRKELLHTLLVVEQRTMEETAQVLGISKQRVQQLRKEYFPSLSREDFGIGARTKETNSKRVVSFLERYGRESYQYTTELSAAFSRAFTRKKQNVKQTGWSWEVGVQDIVWNVVCPILGMELDWFAESRKENSPSFDRIDSNKGYVKGNVQVISWRANRIKNDGTEEEHRKIADYLRSLDKECFNKSIDSKEKV